MANGGTAYDAYRSRGPIGAVVNWIVDLGGLVLRWFLALRDIALFGEQTMIWLMMRLPRRETLLPSFYQIGVLSLPVVALTGTFIGMVLAEQSYSQFRGFNLETRLGAVINLSLLRELGPVLAATMLAGRVGSAMAAELGTMRVTEQIDALSSIGANPIHFLVVPRFLGCLVLIPTLTIMADFMGVVGGAFYSISILPPFWYTVSLFNPVVYLVSAFRWSFFGTSDVGVAISLSATLGFLVACLIVIGWIFRTGYRLKN